MIICKSQKALQRGACSYLPANGLPSLEHSQETNKLTVINKSPDYLLLAILH